MKDMECSFSTIFYKLRWNLDKYSSEAFSINVGLGYMEGFTGARSVKGVYQLSQASLG